jgi:ABC-type glycerol-3-phosphate transport system substrate-binding protein
LSAFLLELARHLGRIPAVVVVMLAAAAAAGAAASATADVSIKWFYPVGQSSFTVGPTFILQASW